VTRTTDTLKGTMKMQAEGMDMVQVMDGKRIGTCDAVAQKKAVNEAVAEIKATGAAETRRSCEDTARQIARNGGERATSDQFKGKGQCAAQRDSMCNQLRSRAATHAGFSAYINHRDTLRAANQPSGVALADCGIDLEKQRPGLCQRAIEELSLHRRLLPERSRQLSAVRRSVATHCRPGPTRPACAAPRSKAAGYEDADSRANAEADKAATTQSAKEAEKNTTKSGGAMDKLKKTFGF
jgi:plasmid stability protein